MLRFISTDAESIGKKRRQSPRACESCRKSKRRCTHLPSSSGASTSIPRSIVSNRAITHDSGSPSAGSSHTSPTGTINSTAPHNGFRRLRQRQSLDDSNSWISDDASATTHMQQSDTPLSNQGGSDDRAVGSRFVGDLNPASVFLAATSPDSTRGSIPSESVGMWLVEKLRGTGLEVEPQSSASLFFGSSPMVTKVVLPLLKAESLSMLPPPSDLAALIALYFKTVHLIFPVIDETFYRNLPDDDAGRVLLSQGMCLAVSLNFASKPHLRLSGSESALTYREFGKQLFGAMRISTEIDLVTDKIVLIQAFSLMSFFVDGPDGGTVSSQLCGRAVQCVHSLGLHIAGSDRGPHIVTLFCCVWLLDRMNAAFNGRPVLMHDRDLGRDLNACFEDQEPSFRVLLHVGLVLDEVIQLYRPTTGTEETKWDQNFPSFEEMLVTCGCLNQSTTLLATIEVLYHAVAILSCRSRASQSPSPSSPSQLRQNFSAKRITSMVGTEYPHQLIHFPFVPYAVSLSLSLTYRELRHSKVPMYRTRARNHLRDTCDILDDLGEIFWTASFIAEMAKSTLKEMDRVISTVSESQQQQRKYQDETMSGDTRLESNDQQPLWSHNRAAIPEDRTFQSYHNGDPPAIDASAFNSNLSSHYDDIQDLDVFDLFDPNFDLSGIDEYLEGTLDLSLPTMFNAS